MKNEKGTEIYEVGMCGDTMLMLYEAVDIAAKHYAKEMNVEKFTEYLRLWNMIDESVHEAGLIDSDDGYDEFNDEE